MTAPAISEASTRPNLPLPDDRTALRRAGLVAGLSLLLMSVLAVFGNLVALEGLVTPGDAARTAADITASEGTFRLAVTSLYAVVVLDVLVAWALFRVFSPVSRDLSRLAAWLRLAYAAVFMVAISQLAGVPDLLNSTAYSPALDADQVHAQALLKIETYHDIWFAGLVLFGAHLVVLGYLAYRSGYVPRTLGVLLIIGGVGYVVDSVVVVLVENPPITLTMVTFLGEFLLAVWLVVRAGRMATRATGSSAA